MIDPAKAALLLLDCENRIVHPDGTVARAMGLDREIARLGTLKTLESLLTAARQVGLCVMHVHIDRALGQGRRLSRTGEFYKGLTAATPQEDPWQSAFYKTLAPVEGEPVIGKFPISAFANSSLAEELAARDIEQLILTGVATHMVVEATARPAADMGFDVFVVEDAVAAPSAEIQTETLARLAFFVDVITSQTVLDMLGA